MVKNYLLCVNDLGSFTSLSPIAQIKFSSENLIPSENLSGFQINDKFIVISEKRSLVLSFENLNNQEIIFNKVAEIEKKNNFNSVTYSFKEIAENEYKEILFSLFSHLINEDCTFESLQDAKHFTTEIKGLNKIYYGAPGTGKSYKVDSIIKELDPKFYERVTFHPEFDNASFVGGYKPVSEEVDGNEVIKYKFVPQAFANIYSRAWKDLENPYYLVIEEINRGNCAEIFGEIFQLLDRNSNYSVTPSKELKEHLIKEFEDNIQHDGIVKGLKLPSNLHILATMNTSDQSLYPMDSAFKRRWDWEYIPICYDEKNDEGEDNPSYHYVIDLGDGTKYKWINFISVINNNHIKDNLSLGMDKCIGNYFVKPLDGNIIELKPFINKVIFYLWNDVFKDEENKVFEKNTSYEDFFPVSTNGLKKVKELFERIGLEPIPSESLYEDKDEGEELKEVAEEREPLA